MTDVILKDPVLDGGIDLLNTAASALWVCSATPTDYNDALTKKLGSKTLTAGAVFGNPADATPDGRQVTSVAVTDGVVDTGGTVTCWAAIDVPNTRLLAVGNLTGGMAVTAGWAWTLGAFTVKMPATAVVIDSEAQLWFDQVVTNGGAPVSGDRQTLVNNFIVGMKAASLWNKFERIIVLAGEDRPQAKTCIRSRVFVSESAGTLTFVANKGMTSANQPITFGFNPVALGSTIFTQNSAHIFCWRNGAGTDGGALIGTETTGDRTMLLPQYNGDNNCYWAVNSSAQQSFANSGGPLGLYLASRTNSTLQDLYINGTGVDTSGVLSAALVNEPLEGFGDDGLTSNGMQCSMLGCGGGLSAAEVATFNTLVHTLLGPSGIGV